MRRKLFNISLSFAIGIIICYIFSFSLYKKIAIIIGASLGITGIIIGAKFTSIRTKKMFLALVLVALSGFFIMAGEIFYYESLEKCADCYVAKGMENFDLTSVRVLEVQEKDKEKFYLTCLARALDVEQNNLVTAADTIKVKLTFYGEICEPWRLINQEINLTLKPINENDRLISYGLEIPKGRSNPRCFDYNLFLKTKRIGAIGTISSYSIIEDSRQSPLERVCQFIMKTREAFIIALNTKGKTEEKSLITGILFGDTDSLDEETYNEFKENGTAHVLAVSGLHIGIIFALFKKIFGRRRSVWVEMVFILMLLCYGTLTLWSVSATRAIGIIILSAVGDRINCRFDLTTALGLVALIILLRNPYELFGAGFQMSFIAVASIVFFTPKLEKWFGSSISFVLAVQLGMAPYIAYTFNYISILSLICNIPIVYLVSLFVPIGMGLFLGFIVIGSGAMILLPLLEGMAGLVIKTNHLMTMGGFFCADVVSPPLWLVVVLYAFLFFLSSESFVIMCKMGMRRKLWQVIGAILLAGVFLMPISSCPADKACFVFLDVGQGDGVHIREADQDVLIDGGGSLNYNVGEKVLKPYFLKNGVGSLDFAIVTHLHTDHFLGVQQLSKEMAIEKFVGQGRKGQIYNLGKDSSIEVLWPLDYNEHSDDENRNSMVMKVRVRGISCLITGDIGTECEEMLLKEYRGTDKLKCDILKVGHHGSKYSSSDEFIDAVNPSIAIIQVGKNNYGHPDKGVIEKFYKKGIMVYRTDYCGAVGIISERGKIKIWSTIEANTASKSLQTI